MTDVQFLPLCDVLFNILSLAIYFCDVVFDLVLGYALFERQNVLLGVFVVFLVLCSLIVSQIVSLKWFLRADPHLSVQSGEEAESQAPPLAGQEVAIPKLQSVCVKETRKGRYVIYLLHVFQLGILFRYAKLFVPVNLRHVKNEVRDLCMLRVVYAFCESAPMLLLQLSVLASLQMDKHASATGAELRLKTIGQGGLIIPSGSGPHSYHPTSAILVQQNRTFKDLTTISAMLSLFSVCWALASFSKNVRLQNVHRLVLTWLGVIFQFFWRLGTVISRVTALTIYASLYHHWIFLVIVMHWVSMLLWLISPKNVFHGEKISRIKKAVLSAMIAFVYVFAYINLQEVNHRQKMTIFYIVMFLENLLLVCLWLVGIWPERPDRWMLAPVTVIASFAIGILFMLTYYRYFHVRRLGYESGGRPDTEQYPSKYKADCSTKCIGNEENAKYAPAVPGVFNCRFTNPVNGATKRKKKKPTSFVPPPNLKMCNGQPQPTNPLQSLSVHSSAQPQHITALQNQIQAQNCESPPSISHQYCGGPMPIPFWKRPLVAPSQNGSSENESSVGSRVNIQQKLQEKKQKQLAELKVIEEEIKQGKLVGPQNTETLSSNDDGRQQTLPRQPIPRIKKHSDLDSTKFWANDPGGGYSNMMMLQNCYADPSNVDGDSAYMREHHQKPPIPSASSFGQTNNLNMPNDGNSLTRAVIAKSKVPRNYHQNIQANTATPSPTIPPGHHHPDTNTTNSNKSSSNQSQSRTHHLNAGNFKNPRHLPAGVLSNSSRASPNVHDAQFAYNMMVPSQKMDSNRGTPTIQNAQINSPIMHLLQQQQQQQKQAQKRTAVQQSGVLSPHPYLEQTGMNSRELYDWSRGGALSSDEEEEDNTHHPHDPDGSKVPSDIDSQMSLPRSYTLPREFKYYRRNKSRKMDNFIASNNSSSDGDVDSVDDNESLHNSSSNNLRANVTGPNKNYYNMTRRQQYLQQQQLVQSHSRAQPMSPNHFSNHGHYYPPGQHISGRVSVPAVGNQPIYLNSPPLQQQQNHSYVRNLDLISNVLDGAVVGQHLAPPPGVHQPAGAGGVRRVRYPGFRGAGGGGGGPKEVRHETKL